MLKLPDGTIKVLVEGGTRARKSFIYLENEDFFEASALPLAEEVEDGETEALMRNCRQQFEDYVKLNKKIPSEVMVSAKSMIR